MRLTTYTDYALRVLMHTGLHEGKLVRIAEIASSFNISRNHLTKVVHQLGARGYLETVQGRHGGIRLARAPAAISVGAVVRDFEEGFALVQCFQAGDPRPCRIESACVLRSALERSLEAFLEHLDAISLADLLKPRRKLQRLLVLPEVAALGRADIGRATG